MIYASELNALKKSNRYRKRELQDETRFDFASNDYLGFGENKELLEKTFNEIKTYKTHAPKSSQVVNGYHLVHRKFEDYLCELNGFESCLVAGSGFLGNLALIEALPRRKDLLILDEEYHASGILASKLVDAEVIYFKHNDLTDLENIISNSDARRVIVAVEGIYSMSGDLVDKQIFNLCEELNFLLIIDEAHSVGVVGEHLLGVFDLYNIKPTANHIKMGTLGKALGSYGAYILCSAHISEYLINRAKSLIYATAPSILDTELAYQGFVFLQENRQKLGQEIRDRQKIVKIWFDYKMDGLIFPYRLNSSINVLDIQSKLIKKGFSVGAIRPPTVQNPMLRIIPRISIAKEEFEHLCRYLSEYYHGL